MDTQGYDPSRSSSTTISWLYLFRTKGKIRCKMNARDPNQLSPKKLLTAGLAHVPTPALTRLRARKSSAKFAERRESLLAIAGQRSGLGAPIFRKGGVP